MLSRTTGQRTRVKVDVDFTGNVADMKGNISKVLEIPQEELGSYKHILSSRLSLLFPIHGSVEPNFRSAVCMGKPYPRQKETPLKS